MQRAAFARRVCAHTLATVARDMPEDAWLYVWAICQDVSRVPPTVSRYLSTFQ